VSVFACLEKLNFEASLAVVPAPSQGGEVGEVGEVGEGCGILAYRSSNLTKNGANVCCFVTSLVYT
jgi:hypothetical protein